jgi:exodeoxyribonuclease V alpha subunit
MQVENDYDREVYNGDLGIVQRVDERRRSLLLRLTVGKSATASANWISSSWRMRRRSTRANAQSPRNLLYTGVTRGKRLVVLVGQRKTLAIAVRSQGSRRR